MPDDMFFSDNERSLIRGVRIAARSETRRRCLVRIEGPDHRMLEGVVMNVNPWSMMVRMLEPLVEQSSVVIQVMRDKGTTRPLTEAREGTVVRVGRQDGAFVDHGIRLSERVIPRAKRREVVIDGPRKQRARKVSRMHTNSMAIGNRRRRR